MSFCLNGLVIFANNFTLGGIFQDITINNTGFMTAANHSNTFQVFFYQVGSNQLITLYV